MPSIRLSLRARLRDPRSATARISVEAFGSTAITAIVALAFIVIAILHIWQGG